MRISELRNEVAPLVGLTPDVLRQKTDMLYLQEELRDVLPGRRHGGGDKSGLVATHAASALVIMTGLVGLTRERIGPAVVRMWKARLVPPDNIPPDKRKVALQNIPKTAGEMLTLLLLKPEWRRRIEFFEVDHDIPHFAVQYPRRAEPSPPEEEEEVASRLVYAPYTAREWKKRVDDAYKRGELAHLSRLPPSTLDKIADLIEAEGSA